MLWWHPHVCAVAPMPCGALATALRDYRRPSGRYSIARSRARRSRGTGTARGCTSPCTSHTRDERTEAQRMLLARIASGCPRRGGVGGSRLSLSRTPRGARSADRTTRRLALYDVTMIDEIRSHPGVAGRAETRAVRMSHCQCHRQAQATATSMNITLKKECAGRCTLQVRFL